MSESEFSLKGYENLLESFFASGYEISDYSNVQPQAPHLILRHDVDMDVHLALDMARAEARLGVRSHYYFLLRSEMYNLFSQANLRAVHEIRELGHEIGLHFDASIYQQDRGALELAAKMECDTLESISGGRVESLTFHRPALALQGIDGRIAGRIHGYERRFFSDIAYVTDSEGRWRFGHPTSHESYAARKAMQLVTHPVWWCASKEDSVADKLSRLLERKQSEISRELAANCKPYREIQEKKAHAIRR